MTENEKLAQLLFPDIDKTTEYYEEKYPPRSLKEGARVSRFAPSPTGFLHFGNLFSCTIAYKTAKSALKTPTRSAKLRVRLKLCSKRFRLTA